MLPESGMKGSTLRLFRVTKIMLLSVRGFVDDLCLLRSSALTLYSLLSIVPVFALLFGVAKGFGFEQMLKERILEQMQQQDTVALQLLNFAENMLASTKGGVVAGIGVVVLFWTVIKVIGNIEESFNAIWRIKHSRPLSRKLSDYLALMFLAPILLIISSSITVFLKTQITWLMTMIRLPETGVWVVLKMLGLSPLVIMSALFTFLFVFIPNHKINLKAAGVAGVVTGILYQTLQWAYLSLQIGASSYNAIYGSFAALPLFIISLQMGWMIVLFGCEMCFYLQNYASYRNHKKFSELSFLLQKTIALQAMRLLALRFINKKPPLTTADIARELAVPIACVQPVITRLRQSQLIVEVKTDEGEGARFQPALDTGQLSVALVIKALERQGQNDLPETSGIESSLQIVEKIEAEIDAAYGRHLICDQIGE
ncbi:MAG: ribonuclease BN [Gammaproteobacteria bacterium HGW-Gammaproteobacteria-3]|nr:MAG: ribonuclease BN [Gammaproteobacteria bacterium HGW-Gammaproteobacteria-3]